LLYKELAKNGKKMPYTITPYGIRSYGFEIGIAELKPAITYAAIAFR
jgi:hypothetical protein